MRHSNDVYLLLSKMSRTEKAYFSKFAFKYDKKESDVALLYQAVEKILKKGSEVDEHFEARVRRQLGDKVSARKIPNLKRRLMDSLLASIHNHSKASVEEEYFWTARQRSDVLLSKNMKEAAWRELERPLAKAITGERFEIAIVLQRKQSLVAAYMRDAERLAKSLEQQRILSSQLDEKYKLQSLYDRIFHLHRTIGRQRDGGHLVEDLQAIMRAPLLRDGFSPQSVTATAMLYSIHQIHGFVIKDEWKSMRYSKRLVDVQLAHPDVFPLKRGQALPVISNLLHSSITLGILEYYDEYFPWLEAQEYDNEHLRANQQYQILKIGLAHAYLLNDADASRQLEQQFIEKRKDLTDDGQMTLMQTLSVTTHAHGNWDGCIQWSNELLDLAKRFPIREDFLVETELLLLAIHIEMDNMDLLPNLIRSLENRMLKKGKFRKRERLQLAFAKKYVKCFHDATACRILIREISSELEALDYRVYGTEFDFGLWLRSMDTGQRYGELVKEANRQLMKRAAAPEGMRW